MDEQTHASLRQLKKAFDEAHRKGMEGLAAGDYDALTAAIEQERAIIDEQGKLLEKLRPVTEPER